jgi:FlgD Ig-like domain/Fibronectin type III domain
MRKDVRRGRRGGSLRAWLSLAAGIAALLAIAPVLAHAQAPTDSIALVWTAPGDDGSIGTATSYELRFWTSPINNTTWDQSWTVPGTPPPQVAGSRQRVVVRGLTNGTTYYFAMKTVDDAGNWSGLSNLVTWSWVYDTAPPAPPLGLGAVRENANDVRTNWLPNAEADLAGYKVYRATSQSGPYSLLTGSVITTTQFLDTTIPQGTTMVWYQVTALDITGNESARSNAVSVSMIDASVSWRFDPGYPNPSQLGSPVHIPMMIPANAANALVEINDSGGHRVWHRELGSLTSGPYTLDWDGTNESGRDVAPGVYTAWLTAGSSRFSIKLVRVP